MNNDFNVEESFDDEVYCWQVRETLPVSDAYVYLHQNDLGCMQCSNYNYCCAANQVIPVTTSF